MKHSFATITKIHAPIEVVWSVMTDHVRYARWGRAKVVTLEEPGSSDPNGVGAIRAFHAGPIKVREQVLEYEAPTWMAYRLVSGVPVHDSRSEMRLEPDGEVTVLTWSSSFVDRVPLTGRFLSRMMSTAVDGFAAGIKAESEVEAGATN